MQVLRRFPAALWVPVYIASLLILNGAHGEFDPLQLGLGIGLVVVSCGLGLYLAFGPWPDGTPRPKTMYLFVGGVIAFYLICGTAAWVLAGSGAGIATFLAGLIPLTATTLWIAMARRGAAQHGDEMVDATEADHEDAAPAVGADDQRPLGDSPAVHDEITPHDLPVDHPGRPAAERLADESGGTTPGHREGGAAPVTDDALVDQRFEKDEAKVRRR